MEGSDMEEPLSTSPSSSIHPVPHFLLARTLRFLSPREILDLRPVCRAWNSAALSCTSTVALQREAIAAPPDAIARYVKLIYSSLDSHANARVLHRLLGKTRVLETLTITGHAFFRSMGDELLRVVSECPRLSGLAIEGLSMAGSRATPLLTNWLLRLRVLRITRCQLGDAGLELLFSHLHDVPPHQAPYSGVPTCSVVTDRSSSSSGLHGGGSQLVNAARGPTPTGRSAAQVESHCVSVDTLPVRFAVPDSAAHHLSRITGIIPMLPALDSVPSAAVKQLSVLHQWDGAHRWGVPPQNEGRRKDDDAGTLRASSTLAEGTSSSSGSDARGLAAFSKQRRSRLRYATETVIAGPQAVVPAATVAPAATVGAALEQPNTDLAGGVSQRGGPAKRSRRFVAQSIMSTATSSVAAVDSCVEGVFVKGEGPIVTSAPVSVAPVVTTSGTLTVGVAANSRKRDSNSSSFAPAAAADSLRRQSTHTGSTSDPLLSVAVNARMRKRLLSSARDPPSAATTITDSAAAIGSGGSDSSGLSRRLRRTNAGGASGSAISAAPAATAASAAAEPVSSHRRSSLAPREVRFSSVGASGGGAADAAVSSAGAAVSSTGAAGSSKVVSRRRFSTSGISNSSSSSSCVGVGAVKSSRRAPSSAASALAPEATSASGGAVPTTSSGDAGAASKPGRRTRSLHHVEPCDATKSDTISGGSTASAQGSDAPRGSASSRFAHERPQAVAAAAAAAHSLPSSSSAEAAAAAAAAAATPSNSSSSATPCASLMGAEGLRTSINTASRGADASFAAAGAAGCAPSTAAAGCAPSTLMKVQGSHAPAGAAAGASPWGLPSSSSSFVLGPAEWTWMHPPESPSPALCPAIWPPPIEQLDLSMNRLDMKTGRTLALVLSLLRRTLRVLVLDNNLLGNDGIVALMGESGPDAIPPLPSGSSGSNGSVPSMHDSSSASASGSSSSQQPSRGCGGHAPSSSSSAAADVVSFSKGTDPSTQRHAMILKALHRYKQAYMAMPHPRLQGDKQQQQQMALQSTHPLLTVTPPPPGISSHTQQQQPSSSSSSSSSSSLWKGKSSLEAIVTAFSTSSTSTAASSAHTEAESSMRTPPSASSSQHSSASSAVAEGAGLVPPPPAAKSTGFPRGGEEEDNWHPLSSALNDYYDHCFNFSRKLRSPAGVGDWEDATGLVACSKLERLSLINVNMEGDLAVTALANTLHRLPALQSVNIQENWIRGENACLLAHRLSRHKSLRQVVMTNCLIPYDYTERLKAILPLQCHLQC